MAEWGSIRGIPIGGLVAVGFLDEERIVVGSHSGLGVFEARSGTLLNRVEDPHGAYEWFRESPPRAIYSDDYGEHVVEVAGMWGGALPTHTQDGWACRRVPTGAELSGADGTVMTLDDEEDYRACGYSPQGLVFVFATSSTLHVAVRTPV